MSEVDAAGVGLRIYPAKKWKGQVLLVCGKCEKKLKRAAEHGHAMKLKKTLKRLVKKDEAPVPVHVIRVGCMDLCPKGGVAVCTQAELQRAVPGLSVVRTKEDVAALYAGCKRVAGVIQRRV